MADCRFRRAAWSSVRRCREGTTVGSCRTRGTRARLCAGDALQGSTFACREAIRSPERDAPKKLASEGTRAKRAEAAARRCANPAGAARYNVERTLYQTVKRLHSLTTGYRQGRLADSRTVQGAAIHEPPSTQSMHCGTDFQAWKRRT